MTSSHHGMVEQRDTQPMKKRNGNGNGTEKSGRFGRMFPELVPLYTDPAVLKALGAPQGTMDGGRNDDTTQGVPLGFVFLGQFIDHDITLDVTSSLSRVNDPEETENVRTPTLDLDCIYGGGPEASRHLYNNQLGDNDGVFLLTGADFEPDPNEPAHHDLMRNPAGDALIGDFRNDENRIVSQLQLAFIKFHNHVAAELRDKTDYKGTELFEEAQRIVRWHYQWIVVNEFLPVMIGRDLVDDILGCGRSFYHPNHEPFIPVEFSAAAYRFGHSMITHQVKMTPSSNAVNLFGRSLGRGFTAVNGLNQVVDWAAFFEINGSHPQLANKLDTQLATELLDLPFINGTPDEKSLATRNLLRGQSFLLPSGEKVAEQMGLNSSGNAAVIQQIRNIAAENELNLRAGTPLWFYILTEAETLGKDGIGGEGLGPVGGRIVGEVLIGLLEFDERSFLGEDRNWTPAGGTFTMADLLTNNYTYTE